MQTIADADSTYSRPSRRRKDSYDEVGPLVPPKPKMNHSNDGGKRFSVSTGPPPPLPDKCMPGRSTKSHSLDLTASKPVIPPPVPTSARPTNTSLSSAASSNPPPLPPRKPENQYSSPKSHPLHSSNTSSIYNIPTSQISNKVPSSYDSLPSKTESKSSTKEDSTSTGLVVVSSSMSLSTLVNDHQHEFPLRVEVTAGYFGESERDTFSEGDMLNIHFAKQVTVAVIDCGGGKEIKVPLNSTLQFSPLYDPNNNYKEAKQGFVFKSAKDVMASKEMPIIMQAKRSHKHMNAVHSVERGDLLKVVEIKQGKFGGQSLICQTLNGKKALKRLSEGCQGEFSTEPSDLKLYLPEITSHLPMPQKAVPFINYMEHRDSPMADTELVKILRVEKEKTVVATALLDEKESKNFGVDNPVMFDIPVNLEILEVQIVEEEEDEYEKLYIDTKKMMENFDPTNKDNQVRVGQAESLYYCDVRADQRTAGIELIASESIYQDGPSLRLAMNKSASKKQAKNSDEYCYTDRKSVTSTESVNSSASLCRKDTFDSNNRDSTRSLEKQDLESSEEYLDMNDGNQRMLSPFPMNPLQKHPSNSSLQDVPSYQMHDIIQRIRNLPESHQQTGDIQSLQSEMEGMKRKLEKLTDHVKRVEQENAAAVEKLQQTVETLSKSQTVDYVRLVPTSERSILNYTCDQLLDFLDKSNMSKYRESFEKEQIDGPLLSQLDDEILENELGVTSKLHRKKLMLHCQEKI